MENGASDGRRERENDLLRREVKGTKLILDAKLKEELEKGRIDRLRRRRGWRGRKKMNRKREGERDEGRGDLRKDMEELRNWRRRGVNGVEGGCGERGRDGINRWRKGSN